MGANHSRKSNLLRLARSKYEMAEYISILIQSASTRSIETLLPRACRGVETWAIVGRLAVILVQIGYDEWQGRHP